MNTTVEIDTAKLDRAIRGVAEWVGEDVQKVLQERVRAVLQDLPVKITVFDPLNDNAALPVVETINKRELAAIYSLINFAAHTQNTRPETVQARVEAHFHVPHVARIPREAFQKAVNYLVAMADYFDEETN